MLMISSCIAVIVSVIYDYDVCKRQLTRVKISSYTLQKVYVMYTELSRNPEMLYVTDIMSL